MAVDCRRSAELEAALDELGDRLIVEALEALDQHNLTVTQARTLARLERHGTLTVGELSEVAGFSLPTASRVVESLRMCGLVERQEMSDDRRRRTVGLTDAGRSLLRDLRAPRRAALRAFLERVPSQR